MPGRQGKKLGVGQECGGVQLLGSSVCPGLFFDKEEQGQCSLVFRVLRLCRSVSTAPGFPLSRVRQCQGGSTRTSGAVPKLGQPLSGAGESKQHLGLGRLPAVLQMWDWLGWHLSPLRVVTSSVTESLSSVFPFLQHPGGFRTGFLQEHTKKMGLLLNVQGVWC